jgi:pyruvate dehydrogenase E2 component (dihydrolipoamide acetyltransferase)
VPTIEVRVPDIGNATDVDVIEIQVRPGDRIEKEQSLITLEGDKATMDIPSPEAGTVKEIKLKVGDKVSKDSLILMLEAATATIPSPPTPLPSPPARGQAMGEGRKESPTPSPQATTPSSSGASETATKALPNSADIHAGPGARRLARELDLDLTKIQGTGPKQRVLKEDIQNYVKQAMQQGGGSASALPQAPVIDFSQFGPIETKPLSRIKKISASNLHRNWLLVPHVTQFDEADITELEAFRKAQLKSAEKQGIKLTPLSFIIKATVAALKAFPSFNASLDPNGEQLIFKHYFHIGVAIDTPDGLVVPVIRDADQKSIFTLAKELGEISVKARNKALTPGDMQGSTFSVSSLGGIGGTAFTPIVNVPNVAILGVSRSSIKPIWKAEQNSTGLAGEFVPRLMLPLSVSYDHRVIDGAEGARFTAYLANCLTDLKLLLL